MANVLRAIQEVDGEDTAADRGEAPPIRE
jgi:hypothetical protein